MLRVTVCDAHHAAAISSKTQANIGEKKSKTSLVLKKSSPPQIKKLLPPLCTILKSLYILVKRNANSTSCAHLAVEFIERLPLER